MIDLFEIHTRRDYSLNRFSVPDSLLQNGLPSGNNILDSLALVYELYIENNSLYSPNNLDPFALGNASWDDPTQYPYSSPLILPDLYLFFGPLANNDIEFEFHEEYTTLIYIYAWDFKQSLREWEFRIYPDCSLEFVGAIGPPIPQEDNTVSIGHKTEFKTK